MFYIRTALFYQYTRKHTLQKALEIDEDRVYPEIVSGPLTWLDDHFV